MSKDKADELSLEARLARLEEILSAIEADDLELGDALKIFEEGVGHIRAAEETLAKAQLRVDEVLGNGTTVPLDPPEGSE